MTTVSDLRDELTQAENDQKQLKEQAALTELRLTRAGKLTSALEIEGQRWQETATQIQKDTELLVGDVFLAAACVSYFGAFTGPYRCHPSHQHLQGHTLCSGGLEKNSSVSGWLCVRNIEWLPPQISR